ncbi:hypothetical protein BD309DRAFT_975513 [Dichomitus squalens]|nr:hypothetical protein BD309DRAFT_975513 [Dichomitus squalens]
MPSANRLSVSYVGATRRLVIDAEVVPKLKVHRAKAALRLPPGSAVERARDDDIEGVAVRPAEGCLIKVGRYGSGGGS